MKERETNRFKKTCSEKTNQNISDIPHDYKISGSNTRQLKSDTQMKTR
jgi:hypothetical protein